MRPLVFWQSHGFNRWALNAGLMAVVLYGGGMASFLLSNSRNLWGSIPPAMAQSLRPEGAAYIIYQRLSFIPLENQYRRVDNGEIDKEHTLISRLIRYNEDIKKRSSSRFDWQLTIADYLGANESIDVDRYPGKSTLQINPAQADIAIINKFTLAQRQALINLLAELYAPPQEVRPAIKPSSAPVPQPASTPARPGLTKPGDANLLLPK